MQNRWSLNRRSWALAAAPLLAIASMAVFAAGPATAHVTATRSAHPAMAKSVVPNKTNMLDCNGWSKKYKSVAPTFRVHCADPRGKIKGTTTPWTVGGTSYKNNGRFMDNGHYVGHDEPSVKFISSTAGSGNTMTYYMQIPRQPAKPATNSGSVVDYAELSPAPWFGLPLCDPNSYPINSCTPDSDSNVGSNVPTAAGSAFMELQLYPPGFTPFQDDVSCAQKTWCAAMTIDSLESHFNFVDINPNCPEPVNFAFIQRNGVPTGPPSPQLTNFHTFTPNAQTLQIHSGDVLRLAISDPSAGFTTRIDDITTGQSGTMTASIKNGFMNTNVSTCKGTPFAFHAEYNTAKAQNQVPWAALQGGVLMQQETGHSEVCTSLANKDPLSAFGVTDPNVFDNCINGSEGKKDKGEGPCNAKTGVCKGATTEGTTGPIACPSNNFNSGQLCEYSDGSCMPQGTRHVTLNGSPGTEKSPVNFCQAGRFQNGDLDFDGIPYQKNKWPNGSPNNPTSFRYAGPFLASGAPYPTIQFETPVGGSEFLCNIFDGLNCDTPPLGAKFYPYWTLTNKAASGQGIGNVFKGKGQCIWNFGQDIPGVTTSDFGKAAQYGTPAVAVFGGTLISNPAKNPEVTGKCPALKDPKPSG
ncbi:MAG TPA: hypothetical protein VGM14_03015 [Streptosporangiaceae bacterium]